MVGAVAVRTLRDSAIYSVRNDIPDTPTRRSLARQFHPGSFTTPPRGSFVRQENETATRYGIYEQSGGEFFSRPR